MENPGNGNLTCLNRLIMENLKEHPGKYIYIYIKSIQPAR